MIAGWAVYFVSAAALVAFPRVLVRTVTPAKVLALSIVVIAASCVYSMLAVNVSSDDDYISRQDQPGWRGAPGFRRSGIASFPRIAFSVTYPFISK